MKRRGFDYSQRYIEHGYLELCIPPTEDGEFAMEQNYLHIWPRGTFMMIALPNQDRSWTVTLFMPFHKFDSLDTPEKLVEFFKECFPDAVALIGQDQLVKDFFATRPSSLVSVKVRDIPRGGKSTLNRDLNLDLPIIGSLACCESSALDHVATECKPYHIGRTALIIGDAAHAMVPFYGQGMNAGFEDCRILDELMERYNDDLSLVLPEFSQTRNEDAEAICDLAMYNYIEVTNRYKGGGNLFMSWCLRAVLNIEGCLYPPPIPVVHLFNQYKAPRPAGSKTHFQSIIRRPTSFRSILLQIIVVTTMVPSDSPDRRK
uniref:FAD-binding domain-containing protein n=1 Tax=Timema douglasi TaxID=61478 RepID=A0A7R8Z4A8_TIMDO|nr:unnamed protein product [Timema douglasi]